jgi:hypothetical protein
MATYFLGGAGKNDKINLLFINELYCTFIDYWVYFDDIRG